MTEIKKELPHHHDDESNNIIQHFPDAHVIEAVAEAMKQLGDPSRLRIFWFLCHTQECVLDIAAAVEMSSPAVSHHLRLLKAAGLIVSHRSGKEMFYKAADTPLVDYLHHTIEELGDISCPR